MTTQQPDDNLAGVQIGPGDDDYGTLCQRCGTRQPMGGPCPSCPKPMTTQQGGGKLSDEISDRCGPITHDEAREMLGRMVNSHFKNPREHMRASIPGNPGRDDDLRMIAYIQQQRAQLAAAKAEREVMEVERQERDAKLFEVCETNVRLRLDIGVVTSQLPPCPKCGKNSIAYFASDMMNFYSTCCRAGMGAAFAYLNRGRTHSFPNEALAVSLTDAALAAQGGSTHGN